MESLPQTILFILTLVCGLSCGLLILGILALYLLGRLNIVRDLFSGLRSAARDDDESASQAAMSGQYGAAGRARQRSSAAQRMAEARARADREFQSGVESGFSDARDRRPAGRRSAAAGPVGRLVQGALQAPLSRGEPGPGRRSRFVFRRY